MAVVGLDEVHTPRCKRLSVELVVPVRCWPPATACLLLKYGGGHTWYLRANARVQPELEATLMDVVGKSGKTRRKILRIRLQVAWTMRHGNDRNLLHFLIGHSSNRPFFISKSP